MIHWKYNKNLRHSKGAKLKAFKVSTEMNEQRNGNNQWEKCACKELKWQKQSPEKIPLDVGHTGPMTSLITPSVRLQLQSTYYHKPEPLK